MNKRSLFCFFVLFCIVSGFSCFSEEGYYFNNFPPVKGKFKEIKAVLTSYGITLESIGIIDKDGYITEVKQKYGDSYMTVRKFIFTSDRKLKEELSLYKDSVFMKEVYEYDSSNRITEIQSWDSFESEELILKRKIMYTYEGNSRKAAYKRMDMEKNKVVSKGKVQFDEKGRIMERTDETYDPETKEWNATRTSVFVFDKNGFSIESHIKDQKSVYDIWCDVVLDTVTKNPVNCIWYTDKEKTQSDENVIFSYK
ncbi:MAG: hypothetical protein JXJ04_03020 [Spirochaetales bacterium]|nr:hypothetical protein [Spirochaetales bacterium]